jgi:3-hydroxymyristoyl/3-hydroxydecanoyl-(acyl carrier protein) dehydratase
VVIVSFDVEQLLADDVVCRMDTVFGFFPSAAFADQPGLPTSDEERAWLERPCAFDVDLTARPARYCGQAPRLPGAMLLMLDRVTGYWPDAGRAGLGRLRAEKRVDASEWFFKAHFFQDPVQPGSLGLEAMLQLLQFYVIERGLADGLPAPRFTPLDLGRTLRWKYRGQVVPANRRVVVEVEVTEAGRDERGAYAVADAWLWVDGKRIYSASNLGVRAVPGAPAAGDERRRASPLDTTGARAFWRRRLGTGPGLAEDLVDGLARQFVGDIVLADAAAFGALRGRPVVFLANHQVAVESLLFATLVPGLHDRVVVALAKAEHRETWMGQLMRLIARVPGGADPRTLVFFDRSDGASLLPILEELRRRMTEEDASLLVHVEGTRAPRRRRPGHAHERGLDRPRSRRRRGGRAGALQRRPAARTGAAAPRVPARYGKQDYRLGRRCCRTSCARSTWRRASAACSTRSTRSDRARNRPPPPIPRSRTPSRRVVRRRAGGPSTRCCSPALRRSGTRATKRAPSWRRRPGAAGWPRWRAGSPASCRF